MTKGSAKGCSLFLKLPVIAIGAPAKAFLPSVAAALETEVIFPEFYAVANAVRAVVGNVIIRQESEVYPCVQGAVFTGYFACAVNMQHKFASFLEALAFARETLSHSVAAQAKMASAEQALVDCEEEEIWDGMVPSRPGPLVNPD